MAGDWKDGFLRRFGPESDDVEDEEDEDMAQEVLDRLAHAAATMPSSMVGMRIKAPCLPCAAAAAARR